MTTASMVLLVLLSFNLCTYAKNERDFGKTDISGSVVRAEENIPTDGTSGKSTLHPFANENFIYRDKGKGIQQISKETGDIRYFANEATRFMNICYVTEQCIFYKYYEKKECMLCRLPIVKTYSDYSGNIEELDFKNRAEVLREKGTIWDIYVTDEYILYHFRDDYGIMKNKYDCYAVKYNRETGEKKYFKLDSVGYEFSYVEGDCVILSCDNEDGYHCLDLKKDDMTHFDKKLSTTTLNPSVGFDGRFYYANSDDSVKVYDMAEKTNRVFLNRKAITSVCKKVAGNVGKGWKYDASFLCDMFYYGDKMYLQVQLDLIRKKHFYMNYIMLSVDMKDENVRLKYEKELTNMMQRSWFVKKNQKAAVWWKYAKYWEDEWNFGRFLTIVDDTAILILDDSPAQVASYDMKTGELKKISKDDMAYYLPYSDSDAPYYGELEDSMHYMPDDTY